MRRLFLSWLALYLAAFPALADHLSAPIGGFPPVSGDVSYTGPGDIETFTAFYGIMAYSSATRGNALLIVCNSTGGTDIGCADMYSSTTNGALVPTTIAGITCPGANCTVKTAYDLTGNGNNTTQSTIANRPILSASGGPGGRPGIFCAPNQVLTISPIPTLTQPFSMSGVAVRTGNTTAFGTIINSGGNGPELPFGSNEIRWASTPDRFLRLLPKTALGTRSKDYSTAQAVRFLSMAHQPPAVQVHQRPKRRSIFAPAPVAILTADL